MCFLFPFHNILIASSGESYLIEITLDSFYQKQGLASRKVTGKSIFLQPEGLH